MSAGVQETVKARQRKQSTKLTRDNIPVVAPVKCQQVNRNVAAMEDELEARAPMGTEHIAFATASTLSIRQRPTAVRLVSHACHF